MRSRSWRWCGLVLLACVRQVPAVVPATVEPVVAQHESDGGSEVHSEVGVLAAGGPEAREPVDAGLFDVPARLARMTLEEKVGQLMMVGFGGLEVDGSIETLVKGRKVGGVCLFKRNIANAGQVAKLNDQLMALLIDDLPPLISVDQEGGNVVRIADGNAVLPGNMTLGATRDTALAYQAGLAQGEDLRLLGFSMNLAPVLDVNSNPRNPVIGIRSFSDEVSIVSELGRAFVKGQQAANIATIAKHFPGHGNVDTDSHHALPVSHDSVAALKKSLEPFGAAMADGLDGVMTAHMAVPSLTGDDMPATLSAKVLTELLRGEMKFDGLVLTDELEMDAIDKRYGVGRAAVMAINAGADMVLIPWRAEKKTEVYEALLAAARDGSISTTRLNDAVRHVIELKVRRGLFEPLEPRDARLKKLGQHRAVAAAIAASGVTLLKTSGPLLPLKKGQRIGVVTSEPALAEALGRRSSSVQSLIVPTFPKESQRAGLKLKTRELADAVDVVVVSVANLRQVELATMATLSTTPVVVVLTGVPYLGQTVPEAKALVAVYSYRDEAGEAVAAALFGEREFSGRLPVSLPKMPRGFGLNTQGERLDAEATPRGQSVKVK